MLLSCGNNSLNVVKRPTYELVTVKDSWNSINKGRLGNINYCMSEPTSKNNNEHPTRINYVILVHHDSISKLHKKVFKSKGFSNNSQYRH